MSVARSGLTPGGPLGYGGLMGVVRAPIGAAVGEASPVASASAWALKQSRASTLRTWRVAVNTAH